MPGGPTLLCLLTDRRRRCGTGSLVAACTSVGRSVTQLHAPPSVKNFIPPMQFFSLDCEMTGLFLDDRGGAYLDEIHDRYQEVSREGSVGKVGLVRPVESR